MVPECSICGSLDITRYDIIGYKCNFCNHDSLYSRERYSYSKEDIFRKLINICIEYKNDNYRYIVLNGKSLRKYNSYEKELMRQDYIRILDTKNDFINGMLSYEEFIRFLSENYNDFGVKFHNRQQCEVIQGIEARKEIINRLSNSISDIDEYLAISVDMVQSSQSLSDLEENINDVSELFKYLTNQFLYCLSKSYYKKLNGDGFIALYLKSNLTDYLNLILEIEKIEKSIADYIGSKKLNIKNDFIRFGVGIDISKVVLIYGIEDIQIGLAINRATKLSKLHIREKYSRGIAITTLRFSNYISKWFSIKDNKEDKHNNTDVYYIEKDEIKKILSKTK